MLHRLRMRNQTRMFRRAGCIIATPPLNLRRSTLGLVSNPKPTPSELRRDG